MQYEGFTCCKPAEFALASGEMANKKGGSLMKFLEHSHTSEINSNISIK